MRDVNALGLPLQSEVAADARELGVDAEALADLVARARRTVEEHGLPSCQLALARHGRLAAFETIGDAAFGSRYVIFSCTKGLVAGAVWLLIGDGLLDPLQRVAEIVPAFGENGKETVTVEQLLLHTAGFPRAPLGPPDWFTREGRLRRFAQWRLSWEPGSRVEYHASSAHWVLAELIETLAGVDYRRFVAERITQPLGIPRFQLGVPREQQHDINDLVVVGRPPTPAELEALTGVSGFALPEIEAPILMRFNDIETREVGVPGAGAVATAADVALYFQALLHNPGGLWDPAVLADGTGHVRTRLQDATLGVPANRSLGLLVAGDDGFALRRGMAETTSPRAFGHHGVGGQVAWADPESGLSFCCLTNGLDANLLNEGRLRAALSNRAGACVATGSVRTATRGSER
jgi:CubicO group peptidase (beta-lactamase class C family)